MLAVVKTLSTGIFELPHLCLLVWRKKRKNWKILCHILVIKDGLHLFWCDPCRFHEFHESPPRPKKLGSFRVLMGRFKVALFMTKGNTHRKKLRGAMQHIGPYSYFFFTIDIIESCFWLESFDGLIMQLVRDLSPIWIKSRLWNMFNLKVLYFVYGDKNIFWSILFHLILNIKLLICH